MSLIVSLIRPFWLPGLSAVSGRVTQGLHDWFVAKKYESYDALVSPAAGVTQANSFTLTVADAAPLLSAWAFDCSRMATAAFESMGSVFRIECLPRSTSWITLKTYYAAFFAAHSILRMLGTSCSYLEPKTTIAINTVIDLYGMSGGLTVPNGGYQCNYDTTLRKLSCKRDDTPKGGAHQFLWEIFLERMRRLGSDILAGPGVTADKNSGAGQLAYLCENLCSGGIARGGWLSEIRNQVNYQHRLGAWFPYSGSTKAASESLHKLVSNWKQSSLEISLTMKTGGELPRFSRTCLFIVNLARELASDMATRHPGNNSFHRYGTVSLFSLMKDRSKTSKSAPAKT